jgi:RHS repeat-associated protein
MNIQGTNTNRFKRMVYKYDLISGKVNHVAYQPPRGTVYYPDMLYHRYSYDAENRLTIAETSADSVIWEKDSRYEYYRHGPLARMVLGEQLVQGVDYAYTLQGWLKGVNSTVLQDGVNDMGGDGKPGETNQYTARDALGFALNYFAGEYQPVSTAVSPFPGHSAYLPAGQYKPLYNGNISSMAVNIAFPNATAAQAPQLYNYSYDQLNRITGMDVYRGLNQATNSWAALALTTDYKERVSYDANGNILTYLRNGVSTINTNMDNLTYNYIPGTNQLKYVQDNVADAVYTDDIDNQSAAGNYTYDPIGNLITDVKDSITLVKWNVYGKITEIQRMASTARPVTNIQYTYDASGNRISKKVAKMGTSMVEYTWYVRDASGNVMAVYNSTGAGGITATGYTLNLTEQHLYGSSRLGVLNRNISVKTAFTNPGMFTFTRGNKFFELSNHLQNVLVTVSDKKLQHTSNGTVVDYYLADVVTANDYYPFGSLMPERNYNAAGKKDYRFGFNGKENDNDVKGVEGGQQDYGLRIYDPRIGKFLSVDPLTDDYPSWSPYPFAMNRPIDGIDLDGGEWKPVMGGEDGKTITDYTWVGFNKDGSAPEGTVSKGSITTNGVTANFSSYFIPYFDFDGNRTGGSGTGTISYDAPSELRGGGSGVNITLGQYGTSYLLTSGVVDGKGATGVIGKDNAADCQCYSVGGLSEYTNRQLGLEQTKRGYSFEGIESDGLGPVDYFLGAGLFKKGAAIFGRTTVNLFVRAVEKEAVQTELMVTSRGMLKALGLGSTGRTAAANLTEELAMKEIVSNPRIGAVITNMKPLSDKRWLGWRKMQYLHTALDGKITNIHYVGKFENGLLTAVDDFKFK